MIAQFGDIFGSDPDFAGGTGAGGDVDRALGRVTYDESALAFALSECAQELERVTGERGRARDVAVALEQENAEMNRQATTLVSVGIAAFAAGIVEGLERESLPPLPGEYGRGYDDAVKDFIASLRPLAEAGTP